MLNDTLKLMYKEMGIGTNDPIYVTGELRITNKTNNTKNEHHHRIFNVKLVNKNKQIQYPLSDLEDEKNISSNGIYVPPPGITIKESLSKINNLTISCGLVLSEKSERKKHDNPLLLKVAANTIREIDILESVNIIKDGDGNILIEPTVINHINNIKKEEIKKLYENQINEVEDDIKTRQKEIKNKTNISKKLDIKINNNKAKQKIILNKNTKLLKENKLIKTEIDDLRTKKAADEKAHMERMNKLRKFLQNKADTLLKLEFIDQEQYDEILGNSLATKHKTGKAIDFMDDMSGSFEEAVAHIQAYLFNKDIIYPKYLLEDYFSLLQTNDLIILAGDSGSGKTNLVKSFADAVGGVSKIIPVKPSWTSSEDLLGYYNPLQKTYLSTPFLEALIEASQNPDIPYFICLDEMNLARVEYYFADFLSVLEERSSQPEIYLYSDEESNHVLSEFNNVIRAITSLQEKYNKNNTKNFYEILEDNRINEELKTILGLSDRVSLISYHSTLRRMLGGLLSTPSSILFPENVRIIGAINIDETTHYLSPKVLDRAHVIKFDNPLLADWKSIEEEVNKNGIQNADHRIKIDIEYFGKRKPYPSFTRNDEFCSYFVELTENFFKPLGVEVGFRTIRQGLNYQECFTQFNNSNKANDIIVNNFILHKILPKFTFDGSTKVGETSKSKLVDDFKHELDDRFGNITGRNIVNELSEIINKSKGNDNIINYWA